MHPEGMHPLFQKVEDHPAVGPEIDDFAAVFGVLELVDVYAPLFDIRGQIVAEKVLPHSV